MKASLIFALASLLVIANCATVNVNPGTGTLTTAISNANNGDILILAPGVYTQSSGQNQLLGKSLTVQSSGGANATILQCTGASSCRLFSALTGETLVINGFTITSTAGLPIYGQSTSAISVQNCKFTNLSSTSGQSGIYLQGTATLDVKNCTFEGGSSTTGQSTGVYINSGKATITNSRFSNNNGPCIYNNADVTIDSCTFISNNNTNAAGGAIYIGSAASKTNVTSSSFYNNVDKGTPTSGTIYCYSSTVAPTLTNNNFCGSFIQISSSCGITTPLLGYADNCGVCNGPDTYKSCNGTCFATPSSCPQAKSYYVSPTGVNGNGGMSTPFNNIQNALNVAQYQDTIYVMNGTHTVSAALTYNSAQGITIKGQGNFPEDTVLNCPNGCFNFMNQNRDTVITNLAFQSSTGSAVTLTGSSPTFLNCLFTKNGASLGGLNNGSSINAINSFLVVNSCSFLNNTGTNAYTGGISIISSAPSVNTASLTVTSSRFDGNNGRGIYGGTSSVISVTNSTFANVSFSRQGGGIFTAGTAITANSNSFAKLENTGGNGDAISCSAASDITNNNNLFCNTDTPVNCGSWVVPTSSATMDNCSVCNGNNAAQDCSGLCFGRNVNDKQIPAKCCLATAFDCAGWCNGPNTPGHNSDGNTTCCIPTVQTDCNNTCFGQKSFHNNSGDGTTGCCTDEQYRPCKYCYKQSVDCLTTALWTSAPLTTAQMSTAAMTTGAITSAALTTALLTTFAMTTSFFTTASMTTSKMTTNAMTTSKMTTNAMTTNEMTTNAMTTNEMTTNAMTTNEMTTNQMTTNEMTTSEMTTAAMTTAEFTTSQMTTNEMTTSEFTTSQLTTNEMTTSKLTTSKLTTSKLTTSYLTSGFVRSPPGASTSNAAGTSNNPASSTSGSVVSSGATSSRVTSTAGSTSSTSTKPITSNGDQPVINSASSLCMSVILVMLMMMLL